jgi:hypothetical protein
MANYPQWNVRLRHEWLAKPLAKKHVKKRSATRVGLWEARQRQKKDEPAPEGEAEDKSSD